MPVITQALILLGAALLVVPLFRKVAPGAVHGYLAAGILIGPFGLGLLAEPEELLHFAELGIVMLMFAIGLEIQPARLWALRRSIVGLGGVQLAASVALLFLGAVALGLDWRTALLAALALSFSSTAVALELLTEKRELASQHGRSATAILLFQAVAVIPVIAVTQATSPDAGLAASGGSWMGRGLLLAVLLGAAWAARYILRPFLRMVAGTRHSGLLTGAALFLLLAASQVAAVAGLSYGLGAFVAGVLLADSEYRHEMGHRVEPFKGLLIGLFLMTLGMSFDVGLVLNRPLTLIGITAGVMVTKFAVLHGLGLRSHLERRAAVKLGLTLAQGGEFAFVLCAIAVAAGVMPESVASLLIAVVVVSMAATPLLFTFERTLRRWRAGAQSIAEEDGERQLRLFVSYSRRDAGEALRLTTRLEREGFAVTLDTRDLPFGEAWQEELDYLIRQADTVVWLVSAASIESSWCRWELDRVRAYGKRLMPVAIAEVSPAQLPDGLGRLQLLPASGAFDVDDDRDVARLTDALGSDRAWLKQQTRLSERARLWEADRRSGDWLLRGAELRAAEQWRDEPPATAPQLDAAVLDLIHASRIAET